MPQNWKTYKLGELCTKITDGAHQSPKSLKTGGFPMASVKDLTFFGLNLETSRKISEADFENLVRQGCKPEIGDVLIAKDGNTALDTVCVQSKSQNVVLLSSVAILRPDPEFITSNYLKFYLRSPRTLNYLKSCYITGAAIPRVVLRDFKLADFTIPPLQEQQSIARILSALDDKIELNLAMNRTLEDMAMALYKHWFVDSDYDQFSKLPLSEILKFVVDNRGKTAPTSSEGIPLIATNCVKNESIFPSYDKVRYVDNDTYENWFRAHPEPGDILFVNKGTPGCVNLVPNPVDFCIAQDMIALRADESVVSNIYLFMYFRSKEVQFEIVNKSVGTTIPHLKKTDLLTFEISIPEFEKMSVLTQKVKPLFSQIEANVKENQTLTTLRDTLLPKLISGEVRVKAAEQMINQTL